MAKSYAGDRDSFVDRGRRARMGKKEETKNKWWEKGSLHLLDFVMGDFEVKLFQWQIMCTQISEPCDHDIKENVIFPLYWNHLNTIKKFP